MKDPQIGIGSRQVAALLAFAVMFVMRASRLLVFDLFHPFRSIYCRPEALWFTGENKN